jgi:hypothetical protein
MFHYCLNGYVIETVGKEMLIHLFPCSLVDILQPLVFKQKATPTEIMKLVSKQDYH